MNNGQGIRGWAINMILNRLPQQQRNNPQAQAMIQAIQNNDSATGQRIAENLCQTYGVSKEQAISQAMQFFGVGN